MRIAAVVAGTDGCLLTTRQNGGYFVTWCTYVLYEYVEDTT